MVDKFDANGLLADLKARGIFNNLTSETKFLALAPGSKIYIGFDPTATSLHLGNYIQIALLKRFAIFGFSPIALLGGATGMIGDPSLRSTERVLLSPRELNANKRAIKRQLEQLGLSVVDNYDWYKTMNVLSFLRNVGKQVSVNYMMAKDSVKGRLETGLSFTEFSYQLIQGWDFKHLYETANVLVQVGGSDQWGNITTGIELIRKAHGEAHGAVGLTVNLLTTSEGKKYGKSAGNAIWLDPKLTSPFALYQFLLSTSDFDVARLLNWLSLRPLAEITALLNEHQANPAAQRAQHEFARELVTSIHGRAAFEEVLALTRALYDNTLAFSLSKVAVKQLRGGVTTFNGLSGSLLDVLVQIGAASSRREAREFVAGGAILVNGLKVTDANFSLEKQKVGGAHLVRKGKRNFYLIIY